MKSINIKFASFLLCFSIFSFLSSGQISPWGTGSINNQNIGPLTVPVTINSHVGSSFIINDYLNNYTYNIYIPTSYDGTVPFGVVTYIDAGATGTITSSWIPVLNDKKLILIAGNNIGNPISVNTRIGVSLAAYLRLKELLNIDSTRVYASGNSGGGRSATDQIYTFPEYMTGAVPSCGSMYLRQVDQDYETHQPNSHYEYGFPYTLAQLDYIRSFDHKYGIMTSYDDFREGDIMNIYHNGMEPDGIQAKILETPGSHCATTTAHFTDAINFVEHPHYIVISDSFGATPLVGKGFDTKNASTANGNLIFNPNNSSNSSRAYAKNSFLWNDPKGAIFRTAFQLDSANYNQNSFFNIGLFDLADATIYNQEIGDGVIANTPSLICRMDFSGVQPSVSIITENPLKSLSNDTLFHAVMNDWNLSDTMRVKYHLWSSEMRIEFNNHFLPTSVSTGSGVKLLDDNRSILIRPAVPYWDLADFAPGTLLTYYHGKLNDSSPATTLSLAYSEMTVADTMSNIPLSTGRLAQQETSLVVYPNPTSSIFYLNGNSTNKQTYALFDMHGRKLKSFPATTESFDISEFPAGMYYIKAKHSTRAHKIFKR